MIFSRERFRETVAASPRGIRRSAPPVFLCRIPFRRARGRFLRIVCARRNRPPGLRARPRRRRDRPAGRPCRIRRRRCCPRASRDNCSARECPPRCSRRICWARCRSRTRGDSSAPSDRPRRRRRRRATRIWRRDRRTGSCRAILGRRVPAGRASSSRRR